MADISVSGMTRPKSAITNSLAMPLLVTLTNNDGTDTSDVWIRRENTAPNPATFTAGANFSSGATTLTASATNGFANVRVGDAVSGSGIGVGSVVTAKASSSSITVSIATTGAGTSATLTFTPPTYDASLAMIRLAITGSGSNLKITVRGLTFDGSASADANNDGVDGVTIADGTERFNQVLSIDLNSFLTAMRVAPSA